jgi:integrase
MSKIIFHEDETAHLDLDLTLKRMRLAAAVRAPRTMIGYKSDWGIFVKWCKSRGREFLPATTDTVALYLTWLLTQHRVSTTEHHASAISFYHREAGLENPCAGPVRELLAGAQRLSGEQPRQKTPLSVDEIRKISESLGREPRELRDRALLVFGFATALRRCNLAMLLISDLSFESKGIRVQIRHEKNDPRGRGRQLGVSLGQNESTCPVRTMSTWIDCRGKKDGPVFCQVRNGRPNFKSIRGDRIAQIIQEAVEGIGLDPKIYAGHSLRSGFVTEAVLNGVNEFKIAEQTGHRDLNTLRRYYRRQDIFRSNASAMVGL